MASLPPDYDPEGYDYSGSASASDESQPPHDASPFFVADSAAPVFPLNGEELTEQASRFEEVEACEHNSSSLIKSIPPDERHVYLCFKEPQSWPALVEAADFDRLPRSLAVTIKMRKSEMTKRTRLTVCEGRDGTESSNGDVMLFPDMMRYKGLTHFDVDTFVDEVLVQNQVWLSGRPERLLGIHIFVCSHASHDIRCGVSGPIIIGRLWQELNTRGLDADVCIRPCTHLGGHKYKANVIVYSLEVKCFASVTADDVCKLVDELSGMGVLVDGHRRSFQGLLEIEVLQSVQNSSQNVGDGYKDDQLRSQDQIEGYADVKASFSMNAPPQTMSAEKGDGVNRHANRFSTHSWWQASWWFKSWEREDTLAAFAVIGAAASVAVAYQLYRIHARN
eukprot:c23613_g3_i1 orf=212-1387(+)